MAENLLCLGDILAEDDPYDLSEAMSDAHRSGTSPETFVREVFADDLARMEHDKELLRESLEQADTEPPGT